MIEMLNMNTNDIGTPMEIVKRLENLNKWQEEQKARLQERQDVQRRILDEEQKRIYEMLELKDVNINDFKDFELQNPPLEPMVNENYSMSDSEFIQKTYGNMRCVEEVKVKGFIPHQTIGFGTEQTPSVKAEAPKIKRQFLKKGEGLKQRFKIDPDALRLDNLPRYKYANAHPRLQAKAIKKSVPKPEIRERTAREEKPDILEKRFQQMFFSEKLCNSTPEIKSSITKCESDGRIVDKSGETNLRTQENSTIDAASSPTPRITWAEVLDSKKIKPVSVQSLRSIQDQRPYTQAKRGLQRGQKQQKFDDENLSIFELIEQKANEGSIDMNSSCVERLIRFREAKEKNLIEDVNDIPVDESLREAGVRPRVEEAVDESYISTENDDYDESSSEGTTDNAPSQQRLTAGVHVRLCEANGTAESGDTYSDTELGNEEDISDSFEKIKGILFAMLKARADEGERKDKEESIINCDNSNVTEGTLNGELQQKTEQLKKRLAELEKELATFKENNLQLIKAKQELELEKAFFEQERQEIMERLNDEKIQMEIYLHDERMKIEDQRHKMEQEVRMQRTSVKVRERREITELKGEIEALQFAQKKKDQDHIAAQARLRAHIRNLERDQKHMSEEIDRLNKENKRLSQENLAISRLNNNKTLEEINRNLAKITPQLKNAVTIAEEAPRQYRHFRSIIPPAKGTAAQKDPKGTKSRNRVELKKKLGVKRSGLESGKCKKTLTESPESSETEEPTSRRHSRSSPDHNSRCEIDDFDDSDLSCELEACATVTANHKHPEKSQQKSVKAPDEGNSQTLALAKEEDKNGNSTPMGSNTFQREIINADGSKDILYPNGNLKKISADGMLIRMLFFNKDIQETNVNEGTVKYYYAETNTWHTSYLDGLEIIEFPNGQTEHRYKNGVVEVHFPNNSVKITDPSDKLKHEEWRFADGTNLVKMINGDKIMTFPNGQKEYHTKAYKRREYPDGTVKILFPDGTQETRYSNGRVRLKDKDGKLVMDTENDG